MEIISLNFLHGEAIPEKYSCDGENINPGFEISGVPKGAKSLVLIMDDPDAPRGLFTHWLVWAINPNIVMWPENFLPSGAKTGINSAGTVGYAGPCPPFGEHRYRFKLFALDAALDLSVDFGRPELEEAMNGRVIARAEIIGTFERKKGKKGG